MSSLIRTYSELSRLHTIEDRYKYLRLGGQVGETSFGFDRFLNQAFYKSREWLSARDKVLVRDNGYDLGIREYPIGGMIFVHHMNPITVNDIEDGNPEIFDPRYLVCCSKLTHDAIHFGDASLLPKPPIERQQWDTCPWR